MVDMLAAHGVLMVPFGKYTVRAVTHLDVSREQIQRANEMIKDLFK